VVLLQEAVEVVPVIIVYFPENDMLLTSKTNPKNVHGYTVVEVIVSLTIMIVMFSVATARLRDYQKRKTLDIAFEQVKKDIRFAQEMALAGRKPVEPAGNACETFPLEGYGFAREQTYSVGPPETLAQYSLYALCRNWGQTVIVKGPVELPSGVNIGALGGGNRFVFNLLGRGTDRTGNIIIPITYQGVTKNITVTQSGNVE